MKTHKVTMQEFANMFNVAVAMDKDKSVHAFKSNRLKRYYGVWTRRGDKIIHAESITLFIKDSDIQQHDWKELVLPECEGCEEACNDE